MILNDIWQFNLGDRNLIALACKFNDASGDIQQFLVFFDYFLSYKCSPVDI